MKNISIIGKFLTIIAAFGLFSLAVAAYSATQILTIQTNYSKLLSGEMSAAQKLVRANRGLQAGRATIAEMTVTRTQADNERMIQAYQRAKESVSENFDAAITAMPSEAVFAELKADALKILNENCKKTVEMASTAVTEETIIASQTEFMANCQPFFPTLTDRIASVADETAKRAGDESVQLEKIAKSTVATTFAVVVGGLVIVLLAGFFAIRAWMVTPIKALAQAMARLSGGDFSTEVGGSERRDEIGGMAKAVQVFKDNGLEAQALAAESAIMRDEAETSRQKTAENDRVRADAMARATSGLGEGLKHLAGGDLTFQLVEPFAIDFETLRTDFNAAVGQLSKTLRVVADATGAIDNGSREVSASAEDLSRRTEQQAASLEETAAALDEITVNVANSSKRADEARKIALQANESANQSGKIVASAVNAMQRIEQSSNEISNIIGVIDEIAFQTNLLALNAGVEAARAGDAGKGFAVVAQEVRELAQRSAKAAKEIKELIGNSSAEVQSGVKLVSDTGVALKTIESYIVAVNQHMDSIATSAREQSVGLAEVNTAVNQMDQVTQQNAAMVEETSAAGVNLANESGRLRELVAQFQLGNSLTQRASAKLAA